MRVIGRSGHPVGFILVAASAQPPLEPQHRDPVLPASAIKQVNELTRLDQRRPLGYCAGMASRP